MGEVVAGHDGVARRGVWTRVVYRCGHVEEEDRGQMTVTYRERVLAEVAREDCLECRYAARAAVRARESAEERRDRVRKLWRE